MSVHALLFTDIVDSTRVVERLGEVAAAALWADHDRRARALLVAHRGREFDRTDGFFLFSGEALACDVLSATARSALRGGRAEEAGSGFARLLNDARERRDRRSEGLAHGNLGVLNRELGRRGEGRLHLEAALAIHREVGNRHAEGTMLGNLGRLHYEQGRLDEASAHHEAALAIHRAMGNRGGEGIVLGGLGDTLLRQGRIDAAVDVLVDGETLLRQVGNRPELARLLCPKGRAQATLGQCGEATNTLDDVCAMEVLAAGPDSVLCHEIAKLRDTLL